MAGPALVIIIGSIFAFLGGVVYMLWHRHPQAGQPYDGSAREGW